MCHSNKSVESETTWRPNTAAVLESSEREKEIGKKKKQGDTLY